MRVPSLILLLAVLAVLFSAACGAVATPEWAAEAQETRTAQAATNQHLTAIAPTFTPTHTPVPPTATHTPFPTSTPAPTNTVPPTAEPTLAPTAAPTEAAAETASGDAARGEEIFQAQYSMPDGMAWSCNTCHSITPDELLKIGPGLWNVSVRGEDRQPGLDAEAYIRNSILNPQDFIAPHPRNEQWLIPMPNTWGDALSDQDIDDLIAYLLTLRD